MKTMKQHLDTTISALLAAALALRGAKENAAALRIARKATTRAAALSADDDHEKEQIKDLHASALVLEGLIYQDMGESEKAEKRFRHALEVQPSHAEALKSLGLFLIANGEMGEALDYLGGYLNHGYWDDLRILQVIADASAAPNASETAQILLCTAWERNLTPKIGYTYGQYLRKIDKHSDAGKVLRMIAIHTENPDIWNDAGLCFLSAGMYSQASEAFREATLNQSNLLEEDITGNLDFLKDLGDGVMGYMALDEDMGLYHLNLTISYLLDGQYEKTLEAVERASTYPANFYILKEWMRSLSLYRLKRYSEVVSEARHLFSSGIRLEGSDREKLADIRWYEIQANRGMDDDDAALEAALAAVDMFPEDARFYFEAANFLYWENEKHQEAFKLMEQGFTKVTDPKEYRSASLTSEDSRSLYILRIYTHLPREEACSRMKQVLEKDITSESLHKICDDLYGCLLEEYPLEKLQAMVEDMYALFPKDPSAIRLMVRLQIGTLQWNLAIETIKKALNGEQPDDFRMTLLNNLGYLRLMGGDVEGSGQALRAALALPNADQISNQETELAVAFWLDGKPVPGVWEFRDLAGQYYEPAWELEKSVRAVNCNLAALALAHGDVDEAGRLISQLVAEVGNGPDAMMVWLAQMFLARACYQPKTARWAYEQYLAANDIHGRLRPSLLREHHPDLFTWLGLEPDEEMKIELDDWWNEYLRKPPDSGKAF